MTAAIEFAYNAFTREDIKNNANALLAESGKRIRIAEVLESHGEVGAAFRVLFNTGSFGLVVLGSPSVESMMVRSVLKINNPKRAFFWLFNGQGGRNTTEIAFFGESDIFHAPARQLVACWAESYASLDPVQRKRLVTERIGWAVDRGAVDRETADEALGAWLAA